MGASGSRSGYPLSRWGTRQVDDASEDWKRRDRPLLEELGRAERDREGIARTTEIAKALGLDPGDVWNGVESLRDAGYFGFQQRLSHSRHDFTLTGIRLRERGRVELGRWPAAGLDSLIDLVEEWIDAEEDPATKTKLQRLQNALIGVGKDVGTKLLVAWLEKRAGL